MSSSGAVELSDNSNEWNLNAKEYLINEIVSPWGSDKFPWALIAKVDSVDALKSSRQGGCIYSAAKLSDSTGAIRCVMFRDAGKIVQKLKVGGTYRFENCAVKEANPAYSRDGRYGHKCELTLPASNLIWSVVGSGYPAKKTRKVEEIVDIVLPSTFSKEKSVESAISISSDSGIQWESLFLKSFVNEHWGFPVCSYSVDCMQKLERVGEDFKCGECDIITKEFDWHLCVLFIVFDGYSNFEVMATSSVAEKILVGKYVSENDTERLSGVAMSASNKLFNFSFLTTKQGQTVTHKRVQAVSECSIPGAESIIKKMLRLLEAKCDEALDERLSV